VRGSRDCLCFSKGSLRVVVERTRTLLGFFHGIQGRGRGRSGTSGRSGFVPHWESLLTRTWLPLKNTGRVRVRSTTTRSEPLEKHRQYLLPRTWIPLEKTM
jgi:hypothetical protein